MPTLSRKPRSKLLKPCAITNVCRAMLEVYAMSTAPFLAEQRVILDHISWQTYVAILHDADHCRGRMTYDRGVLEIMAPSKLHENVKRLIGRMVEAFTEERNIDMVSASSTTFKREDLDRGF